MADRKKLEITELNQPVTMRSLFDDVAEGDLGRFSEALFDGLGRQVREEVGADDAASPDADSLFLAASASIAVQICLCVSMPNSLDSLRLG